MVNFSEQFPNNENKGREDEEKDKNTSEKIVDGYDNKIENTSEKPEIENQDPDLGILPEDVIKEGKKQLNKQIEEAMQKKLKRDIGEMKDKEKGE